MLLTKEQWFEKLKSWVPAWWFEDEQYQIAVLKAIAATLQQSQATAVDHVRETFITEAEGLFLDAHGDERAVERITDEPDSKYSERIRNIINTEPKFRIKQIVDALLVNGECKIIEHMLEGIFCNRGSFLNRDEIFNDRRYYNHFTVLIPKQDIVSDSFYSRLNFLSRKDYLGSATPLPPEVILAVINRAIEKAKAFGVSYRVIEQS